MLLLNNGITLDPTIEHEINADGHGVDVTVIDKDGSTRIFHNCTEVHYMFPRITSMSSFGEACAFESDIHSTGCTRDVDSLLVISINTATQRHEDY